MINYEKIIRYASLSAIIFASSMFVSLSLFKDSEKHVKIARRPAPVVDLDQLCSTEAKENSWRYIVIHHSATKTGSAARFDDYHRNKRKWEHGLAYHFVIGNGSFSEDGAIEVGERWKKQIHGAHTANMSCNRIAIGVCLVGDFENEGEPTNNQFESLTNLVQHLSRKYCIPLTNIILHKHVTQKGTACPGKNFPYAELQTRLIQIASKESNHI